MSFKDILNESLLNKSLLNESLLDDEDELFDRNDKTLVELWIKENYKIYGTLKIYEDKHGFVVDSNDKIKVTNKDIKSLTNGMFRWGSVAGKFDCAKCAELISLEGAPNECDSFDCSKCAGLRSLKGAPNECIWFYCSECTELRTLEGTPNECDGFDCSGCIKLTSLKGVPKECNHIECNNCTNLTITDNERKKYKIKS